MHELINFPIPYPASEGLETLLNFTLLEDLDLSCCENLTDEGLKVIGKLASLKSLALSDDKISDEGLQYLLPLNQLSELWLYGCDLVKPEDKNITILMKNGVKVNLSTGERKKERDFSSLTITIELRND